VIQPPRRRLAIAHRASRSHLRMMMARDYACRPWFWGNHAVTLSSLGLSHVRTINVVEIQRTYVLDRGARLPQLAWHATLRLSWPRRPAIGAKAARLLHCLLLAPSNRQAHAAAVSVAADRWRRPRQANGASAGIPRPPPVAAPPWTPTCSVSPPNAVAGRAAAVDSATEWSV